MKNISFFHLITFLLFCPFLLWAQEFNLSGVVWTILGETLPGVSIAVKGLTRGSYYGYEWRFPAESKQGGNSCIFLCGL